jgi:hypothetical protein
MSLITIACNSQSNCNVGEVSKSFIDSIIKRDYDTYIKYNGALRIELAQGLERTPEFDRENKKAEFFARAREIFYAKTGYWHNLEIKLKSLTEKQDFVKKPLKVLQIEPSSEESELFNTVVYVDTGIPFAGKNVIAKVYVSDKYCMVFRIEEYMQ